MNIVQQIATDCRSRAKWVREQTAQGIRINETEYQSAQTLMHNAFKWDFDSAATELSEALSKNKSI